MRGLVLYLLAYPVRDVETFDLPRDGNAR